MRYLNLIVFVSCLALTPLQAFAQPESHSGHTKQMNNSNHMKMMSQQSQHMIQMLGQFDAQYDLRFINMMIMHHEGAIQMAENALKNSRRADIQELAKKMISNQKNEIDQLKSWRKQWYGQ